MVRPEQMPYLSVGRMHQRRFHSSVAELKARIGDGRLGVLSHCQSEQTAPAGLSMRVDYWRSDPAEAPAGAMTATGVHNIDLLIHLFGRIDDVYCLSHRPVMARLDDTTAVLLALANGMSATLYCSLVTAVSARFAVFGTKSCAELCARTRRYCGFGRDSTAYRDSMAPDAIVAPQT
jgi:predicted dehydrogenase